MSVTYSGSRFHTLLQQLCDEHDKEVTSLKEQLVILQRSVKSSESSCTEQPLTQDSLISAHSLNSDDKAGTEHNSHGSSETKESVEAVRQNHMPATLKEEMPQKEKSARADAPSIFDNAQIRGRPASDVSARPESSQGSVHTSSDVTATTALKPPGEQRAVGSSKRETSTEKLLLRLMGHRHVSSDFRDSVSELYAGLTKNKAGRRDPVPQTAKAKPPEAVLGSGKASTLPEESFSARQDFATSSASGAGGSREFPVKAAELGELMFEPEKRSFPHGSKTQESISSIGARHILSEGSVYAARNQASSQWHILSEGSVYAARNQASSQSRPASPEDQVSAQQKLGEATVPSQDLSTRDPSTGHAHSLAGSSKG
jgi:hypothetical protein